MLGRKKIEFVPIERVVQWNLNFIIPLKATFLTGSDWLLAAGRGKNDLKNGVIHEKR